MNLIASYNFLSERGRFFFEKTELILILLISKEKKIQSYKFSSFGSNVFAKLELVGIIYFHLSCKYISFDFILTSITFNHKTLTILLY